MIIAEKLGYTLLFGSSALKDRCFEQNYGLDNLLYCTSLSAMELQPHGRRPTCNISSIMTDGLSLKKFVVL